MPSEQTLVDKTTTLADKAGNCFFGNAEHHQVGNGLTYCLGKMHDSICVASGFIVTVPDTWKVMPFGDSDVAWLRANRVDTPSEDFALLPPSSPGPARPTFPCGVIVPILPVFDASTLVSLK